VKFSLEGSKYELVVILACSRCKIPKEKVHVSKYKSSREKVRVSKYKIWTLTFWTFAFGQAEMKQAPIKNLYQLNFTCLLQKNVSDF
jgi:hypothetical protein